MNETERALLDGLEVLNRAVQTLATAQPKPDLQALFARIDALAAELPSDTDPVLRHYLQKKSYEKARFFLYGRDSQNEPGPCGHV
jgi:hypothetical protein